MNIDKNKKVLVVVGMDYDPESVKKKFQSDDILILPCYGPSISPFGDLMRSIILAVYQEKVEEIFVSVSKQNHTSEIVKKLYENKDLQKKMQTLDYLFKNCMPELPYGSLRDWLEGSEGMENIINVIQNHPLMPSDVKVTELLIESEVAVH